MKDINILIQYIKNIIKKNNITDKNELINIMNDVRDHTKGYSDYNYYQVEQYFKIPKAYPNSKINIEQWVLFKISKK
jgi:hypothetical protein